jgi:Flp pilus assembly pilin Flp
VNRFAAFWASLWRDERAEIGIEYGLLVAMVALALVIMFGVYGTEVGEFFNRVTGRVRECTAVPGQPC